MKNYIKTWLLKSVPIRTGVKIETVCFVGIDVKALTCNAGFWIELTLKESLTSASKGIDVMVCFFFKFLCKQRVALTNRELLYKLERAAHKQSISQKQSVITLTNKEHLSKIKSCSHKQNISKNMYSTYSSQVQHINAKLNKCTQKMRFIPIY